MKHYTVTCVETCPTCKGLGTVPADVLAGFLAASVNIELDDEGTDPASFPAGEAGHLCPECHGDTLKHSTVRLDEALRALGFRIDLDPPARPAAKANGAREPRRRLSS